MLHLSHICINDHLITLHFVILITKHFLRDCAVKNFFFNATALTALLTAATLSLPFLSLNISVAFWCLYEFFSGCPWARRSTVSSGERSSSRWIKTWWERTAATTFLEARTTRMWRSWGQTTIFFSFFPSTLNFYLSPSPSPALSFLSPTHRRTYSFHILNPEGTANEFHALLTLTKPSEHFWCILRANSFPNEEQEDLNSILV